MASRLKKGLGGIALIFAGLLVGIFFAEIALRILPIPNRFTLERLLEQQWEPDPELLLRLKPNLDMTIYGHPEFSYTVQTNSEGLRDEPFEGDFAIAAIGDSFTFGFGVEEEESWPARLEDKSGKRVANLGWAGWNSAVYPVAIRRHAIPLNTRVWLWGFFLNDLPESAGADEFLRSDENNYLEWRVDQGFAPAELPFPFSLRVFQMIAAIFNPELFLLPNSGDRIFEHPDIQMRVGPYSWQETDPEDPTVQLGWELTDTALQEAAALAEKNQATLVVIFIPSREHVYWPHIQELLPEEDIKQLDDAEAKLASICDQLGIHYLNLLPGFRAASGDTRMLYFPSDGHWNTDGHDLAATLILNYLAAEELIKQ